jgi:hypothetical protein
VDIGMLCELSWYGLVHGDVAYYHTMTVMILQQHLVPLKLHTVVTARGYLLLQQRALQRDWMLPKVWQHEVIFEVLGEMYCMEILVWYMSMGGKDWIWAM